MPAHRDKPSDGAENGKDLHGKRARGEVSCAECRRLKLKCDRKLPCTTCSKRGCGSICPNGSLKSGSGTRLILADTDQLHAKITEMSERIRTLENALELLHGRYHPGTTHPLLKPELLSIKSAIRPPTQPSRSTLDLEEADSDRDISHEEVLVDAFGALAISPDGAAHYFGRAAGTEMIIMRLSEKEAMPEPQGDRPYYCELADAFPFSLRRNIDVPVSESLALLKGYLPPYDRAWALCQHYLDAASFYFRPIIREDLLDFIFAPVYNELANRRVGTSSANAGASIHPHHLGLVFFICSIGSLCDLNLPPRSAEAEKYFQLGKAAMSLKSIFQETTFETVMAVGFLAVHYLLSEKAGTMTWKHTYLSVTCLLAQNLGLHRDPARWGLPPRIVDMRRRAFWEINSIDHMQSIVTACPAFFTARSVDCEPPMDKDQSLDSDGSIRHGYWAYKIYSIQKVLSPVNVITTSAKLPSYQTIMSLDARIRANVRPVQFIPTMKAQKNQPEVPSVLMERYRFAYCEAVLLIYLHRTYFVQCTLDHPTYPDHSPYAASYKATYDSAVCILKLLKQDEASLRILIRFPYFWSHAQSAAIIVGSAIARGPNQVFAPAGLINLANAVVVFEQAAAQGSNRARMALLCVTPLLKRAQEAYHKYVTTGAVSDQCEDDNLEMFGGRACVFLPGARAPASLPTPPSQGQSPQTDDASAYPAAGLEPSGSQPVFAGGTLFDFTSPQFVPSELETSLTFRNGHHSIFSPPDNAGPGPGAYDGAFPPTYLPYPASHAHASGLPTPATVHASGGNSNGGASSGTEGFWNIFSHEQGASAAGTNGSANEVARLLGLDRGAALPSLQTEDDMSWAAFMGSMEGYRGPS